MLPMATPGRTGYCSRRCLLWAFFDVPALHRKDFRALQLQNRKRQKTPDDFTPPEAYPALYDTDQFDDGRDLTDFIGEEDLAEIIVELETIKAETPGLTSILYHADPARHS